MNTFRIFSHFMILWGVAMVAPWTLYSQENGHLEESLSDWKSSLSFAEKFFETQKEEQEGDSSCVLKEVDPDDLDGCSIEKGKSAPPIFEITDADDEILPDPRYWFEADIRREGGAKLSEFTGDGSRASSTVKEGWYFQDEEGLENVNLKKLAPEILQPGIRGRNYRRYSSVTKPLLTSDAAGEQTYIQLLESGAAKALPRGSLVLATGVGSADSNLIHVRVSDTSVQFDEHNRTRLGSKYGLFSDRFVKHFADKGSEGYVYAENLEQIGQNSYLVIKNTILLKGLNGDQELSSAILSLAQDGSSEGSFLGLDCPGGVKPLFNRVDSLTAKKTDSLYTLSPSCYSFENEVDLIGGRTPPSEIHRILGVINRDYPEGSGVRLTDLRFTETGGVVVPHHGIPSIEDQKSPYKITHRRIEERNGQRYILNDDRDKPLEKGISGLEAFGPEGHNQHYPRYVFFNLANEAHKRLDREFPSLESYCVFEKMMNVWERVCGEIIVPFYVRKKILGGSPPLDVVAPSRNEEGLFTPAPWAGLDANSIEDSKLRADVERYQANYDKALTFCTLQLNDLNFVSNFVQVNAKDGTLFDGPRSERLKDVLDHMTHFSSIDLRTINFGEFVFGNQSDDRDAGEALLSLFYDMGAINTYANTQKAPSSSATEGYPNANAHIKTISSHNNHHHIALPTSDEFLKGELSKRHQLENDEFGIGFVRALYQSFGRKFKNDDSAYKFDEAAPAFVDKSEDSESTFPEQLATRYQSIFKEEWGYTEGDGDKPGRIGETGPLECFKKEQFIEE